MQNRTIPCFQNLSNIGASTSGGQQLAPVVPSGSVSQKSMSDSLTVANNGNNGRPITNNGSGVPQNKRKKTETPESNGRAKKQRQQKSSVSNATADLSKRTEQLNKGNDIEPERNTRILDVTTGGGQLHVEPVKTYDAWTVYKQVLLTVTGVLQNFCVDTLPEYLQHQNQTLPVQLYGQPASTSAAEISINSVPQPVALSFHGGDGSTCAIREDQQSINESDISKLDAIEPAILRYNAASPSLSSISGLSEAIEQLDDTTCINESDILNLDATEPFLLENNATSPSTNSISSLRAVADVHLWEDMTETLNASHLHQNGERPIPIFSNWKIVGTLRPDLLENNLASPSQSSICGLPEVTRQLDNTTSIIGIPNPDATEPFLLEYDATPPSISSVSGLWATEDMHAMEDMTETLNASNLHQNEERPIHTFSNWKVVCTAEENNETYMVGQGQITPEEAQTADFTFTDNWHVCRHASCAEGGFLIEGRKLIESDEAVPVLYNKTRDIINKAVSKFDDPEMLPESPNAQVINEGLRSDHAFVRVIDIGKDIFPMGEYYTNEVRRHNDAVARFITFKIVAMALFIKIFNPESKTIESSLSAFVIIQDCFHSSHPPNRHRAFIKDIKILNDNQPELVFNKLCKALIQLAMVLEREGYETLVLEAENEKHTELFAKVYNEVNCVDKCRFSKWLKKPDGLKNNRKNPILPHEFPYFYGSLVTSILEEKLGNGARDKAIHDCIAKRDDHIFVVILSRPTQAGEKRKAANSNSSKQCSLEESSPVFV